MCPNWLKKLLKYFSLWSFHFVSFAKVGGNVTSFFMFVGHIGLCSWCSFSAFNEFAKKQALMEFIDALNFCLYYITSSLLYWFILFDSHTNKRAQQTFWKSYNRANEQSCSELNLQKDKYLTAMISLLIADVLTCAIALASETNTDVGRIMHLTFLCVVDHRMFFYLLHLKVIAFQLQKIQEISFTNRFHLIRDQYKIVFEMSEYANIIFDLSHLALIMLSFHSSVTFLNFIYRLVQRKFEKYQIG